MHGGGDAWDVETDPPGSGAGRSLERDYPDELPDPERHAWTLKRHAGTYDWQTVIGATGGKIGFYGVTPATQPAGADQTAVALGHTDGEIGGLTISDPPTQAEVQALRDKCEELADVR
jgi:hypothetical protein